MWRALRQLIDVVRVAGQAWLVAHQRAQATQPFIEQTKALLCEEYTNLESALQEESPVSIRVNKTKPFLHNETIEVPYGAPAVII